MNNEPNPLLYIAIPVTHEAELLPEVLQCLLHQDHQRFRVFICVNQPDEWWEIPEKKQICEANVQTLGFLEKFSGLDITVIDRCTPGNGWKGKKHGVGWARKTLMDEINRVADARDIVVSLDADTTFRRNYFSSILENFTIHPDAVAVAVPYYHELVADEAASRSILRYEIYMRYYSLNLWRIGSPYSFTALGSAMAFPVWAYRAVGGMTPKMSGEDFYFLQKLRKYGKMVFSNPEKVYPASRFSDRVYFGTGPAMIRGNEGDWSSYPIYSFSYFDEIRETTELFREFFTETRFTKVVGFLVQLLKEEDPFQLLRENFREPVTFVRACHEKFDGLRILQYLKYRQKENKKSDEENLTGFLTRFYPGIVRDILPETATFSFAAATVDELDKLRKFLVLKEEEYQVTAVPSLPGQLLPAV
ncbi:MAG: glycosyltransferase [Bacteroidetes bacterium]|nr:glycosyltransferase [Bacteroidota bacterium]